MANPGTIISKWTGGVNSLLPPDAIGMTQYAWGINIVNRGGIVQTRPGYDLMASIAGTKAQGGIIFTPRHSRPMMLVATNGEIFMAKSPFQTFTKIDGLKFRADAQIITFCVCQKNAKVNPDQSVELVEPTTLVIIQDGSTNPGYYDGVTARHLQPDLKEGKIGLWMAFVGNRLWVFEKARGFASDLASPDTFFEGAYLAERDNFDLPGDVTGAIQTSDENSLLVFTETTTTAFKANILDRTKWETTDEFQKQILPTIGCVAGRSIVNQYGLTWWMSRQGFINLDAAMQSQRTKQLITVDGRMMRSRRILASTMEFCAATHFENYLLVSVPSGGRYNEETWVGDQSPSGDPESISGMAWVGVWTGIRPVQWMRTKLGGRERLFCLTFDDTKKDNTHIHIWEAFMDDRRDNDGRISCQFETGMFLAADLIRFQYAEIDIVELLGDVELTVFVGGMRGEWYQVKKTTLQAEIGCIGSSVLPLIETTSILQAFKPQTRFIKTEDFTPTGKSCGIEGVDRAGIDKGFQLLLEWNGRMGVKAIKFVAQPDSAANRGECKPGEQGKHNIVTEEGVTIK